jgi:hypothetical protein
MNSIKPRRRRKLPRLFLPETAQGMLALAALILVIVAGLVPAPGNGIALILAALALLLAWVAAIRSLRRKRRRLAVLRALTIPVKAMSWYLAFTVVFVAATLGLAALVAPDSATPGSVFGDNYVYFFAEVVVALAVVQTVIFIPRRLFRIKLDMQDRKIRDAMLGFITTIASGLTGCYIIMLHYDGGELSSVRAGQLAVGAIFTVALMAPVYRSFSRSCWEHGYHDLFSPLKARRRWAHTLRELEDALNRAATPPASPQVGSVD